METCPSWARGVALVKPIAEGIPSRSSEWYWFWAWLLSNDNVMPRVTGFSLEDLKKRQTTETLTGDKGGIRRNQERLHF